MTSGQQILVVQQPVKSRLLSESLHVGVAYTRCQLSRSKLERAAPSLRWQAVQYRPGRASRTIAARHARLAVLRLAGNAAAAQPFDAVGRAIPFQMLLPARP